MKELRLSPVLLLCLFAAGCSIEPPLHLRKQMDTRIELDAKVNISLLWQVDWEARWNFRWDTEVYGPIGYTEPASMRVHVYSLDMAGTPVRHTVNNFYGTTSIVPITVGTHDLLFHNNDSEVLLFSDGEEMEDVFCTTRIISTGIKDSSPVMTSQQKAQTKVLTKEPEPEAVALMPDQLFSLFDPAVVVTDNPADYEYIDGRYVLRIEGELSPSTYIYLFQLRLNNNCGRVTGSEGGSALTGIASSVNVRTRCTADSTVSVTSPVLFDPETDMMGIRMLTFGIPGCNPYDEASVAASQSEHFLVVNICYYNGTWRNIRIDVTDAVRALPLGGVIDLELDVDDFPPDGSHSGGGFEAIVDNWEEKVGGITVIK